MLSFLGSAIGAISNNANIDHQISEQRKENQANRDWNLNLAKQQNQWNIEQWNRENAYNTPAAQMARYKSAGLNPDLMYGQQNLSAASPEMTAGDGSLPTDVSNLANKRTMLDLVSASLDNRLKMEQLKGLKEDNKGKNLDNKSKEYINYFHGLRKRDEIFIRKYFTNGEIPDSETFSKDFDVLLSFHDAQLLNRLRYESEKARKDLASSDIDLAIKKIDRKFKEGSIQTLLDDLSEKLKITKAEAEYYIKTVALRIKGLKLDNKLKENDDFWSDPGIIKQLPEGIPTAIRLLNLVFRGG
uniref:hypothetical protein n=1 Tax=Bacteroides finegoldii TaxID=338188 RepID=UPI003562FDF2